MTRDAAAPDPPVIREPIGRSPVALVLGIGVTCAIGVATTVLGVWLASPAESGPLASDGGVSLPAWLGVGVGVTVIAWLAIEVGVRARLMRDRERTFESDQPTEGRLPDVANDTAPRYAACRELVVSIVASPAPALALFDDVLSRMAARGDRAAETPCRRGETPQGQPAVIARLDRRTLLTAVVLAAGDPARERAASEGLTVPVGGAVIAPDRGPERTIRPLACELIDQADPSVTLVRVRVASDVPRRASRLARRTTRHIATAALQRSDTPATDESNDPREVDRG